MTNLGVAAVTLFWLSRPSVCLYSVPWTYCSFSSMASFPCLSVLARQVQMKATYSCTNMFLFRGVGTWGGTGGTCPPPIFSKDKKWPFLWWKVLFFVQANVAINTGLTSKMPFLFGNFDVLKKILAKNVQFWYSMTGKCFFIQKCPWKPVPPPPIFWCFLRPCFSLILRPITSLSLTLLCTKHDQITTWKRGHHCGKSAMDTTVNSLIHQ